MDKLRGWTNWGGGQTGGLDKLDERSTKRSVIDLPALFANAGLQRLPDLQISFFCVSAVSCHPADRQLCSTENVSPPLAHFVEEKKNLHCKTVRPSITESSSETSAA